MVTLAGIFMLTGCGSPAQVKLPAAAARTLRIVSSLPWRGQSAAESLLMRRAIDMAVEERKATLSGWDVQHIALDGGDAETGEWSRTAEEANARAAADDPATVAYIGPYNSGAAMVSAPLLNRAGLLQMLPVATWPGLTQSGWGQGEPQRYYPTGKRTLVRIMPSDSALAQAAAQKAQALGAKTAWTLSDGSDYSEGMVSTFDRSAQARAIQVVQRLKLGGPDFSRISDPTQSEPDALFIAPSSLGSLTKLIEARRQNTTRPAIFVTDVALSDQLSESSRRQMEGWHILFNDDAAILKNPAYIEFARKFQARYGTSPSRLAANAYDLASIALEAVAKAGRDRARVVEAVLDTQKLDGATGVVRFDESGDVQGRRVSSYTVISGQFSPEAAAPVTP